MSDGQKPPIVSPPTPAVEPALVPEPKKPKAKRWKRRRRKPPPVPLKNLRGRPFAFKPTEREGKTGYLNILEGLGAILSTTREASAVLGISEPTLFALFKRDSEARLKFEIGKEKGKVSLRRNMFSLSTKNATMALFLAMNILGMKDRRAFGGDNEEKPTRIIFEGGLPKVDTAPPSAPADEKNVVRLDTKKKAKGGKP